MNGLCWEKYFAPQLWGNGLVAWDARFTLKEIWYKRKTNPFDSFHNFEEVKKALLNFGALFQWVVGHLSEKMLQWCNVYIRGRANLPFPVRLKPQKWLYLANTFLAPPPRGVVALVSVSDDKIQITMLIPGRSALSRRGSMSIQNLNFLKVSYPGTPCILSSSSSSTYIIYREVCLTFISLLKNIVNLFKWLIVKLNICQILLLLLLCITTIVIFIFQCQPSLRDCLCHPKFDNFANCMQKFTLTSTRQWCLEEGVSPKSRPGRCWQRGRCTFCCSCYSTCTNCTHTQLPVHMSRCTLLSQSPKNRTLAKMLVFQKVDVSLTEWVLDMKKAI